MIVHSKDWEADDMAEISARLKSVTPGAASQEFSLRRNQLGQLGFHVQHDGLITEVNHSTVYLFDRIKNYNACRANSSSIVE